MKKIKVKLNKPVYLGLPSLEINKTLLYAFSMVVLNQSIKLMLDHATSIQIALLFILKLKMFVKILQMMLKKIFDTSSYEAGRPLYTGKSKKVIGSMKDELRLWQNFFDLDQKLILFLMNGGNSNKKAKGAKNAQWK